MKLTTPIAILISSLMLVLAIMFRPDGIPYVDSAMADVAGMDYRELKRDRDFKKAVKYIVQNCGVTGYVDGDYLYSANISC